MSEVLNTQEPDNIMGDIQGMITGLLTNAVDKMQKAETRKQLGETSPDTGSEDDLAPEMGITEIKSFISVMQKFIDNINVMVKQLETGSADSGDTDDAFLDGYMATADNILEIAAFSMKDSLTGLSNRYGFDNRIILEWNRATRDKTALGLVIFGLDGFESCDDSKRDDIIKEVSQTLINSSKRSTDFIARWSDDDFAALLPITDTDGTAIVVERIRTEIEKMNIAGLPKSSGKTAISMGVGVFTPEPGNQPIDFINKTFDAYQKAKKSGACTVNID